MHTKVWKFEVLILLIPLSPQNKYQTIVVCESEKACIKQEICSKSVKIWDATSISGEMPEWKFR
jgi:hypothetical protein